MNETKNLMEQRIKMKKKPVFVRKNIHKKTRLLDSWRRPRGLHNKQRLNKRGAPRKPSSGYRAPRRIRGLHKSKLVPVVVSNLKQLDAVTGENGVLLSSRLGDAKRHTLLTELRKRGFALLNFDVDKKIAKIESDLKERKEERKKKLKRREEKKRGIEDKVKKKDLHKKKEGLKEEVKEESRPKGPEELSEEEKKKLEKQEKDKLLTKKT